MLDQYGQHVKLASTTASASSSNCSSSGSNPLPAECLSGETLVLFSSEGIAQFSQLTVTGEENSNVELRFVSDTLPNEEVRVAVHLLPCASAGTGLCMRAVFLLV